MYALHLRILYPWCAESAPESLSDGGHCQVISSADERAGHWAGVFNWITYTRTYMSNSQRWRSRIPVSRTNITFQMNSLHQGTSCTTVALNKSKTWDQDFFKSVVVVT
jgi:hypothetical protein